MKKVDVVLGDYLADDANPANHELESRDLSVFKVAKKAGSTSVWTITPVNHGIAMAEIVAKADGMVVKTLTVTVENRAPVRKTPLMVPGLEICPSRCGTSYAQDKERRNP